MCLTGYVKYICIKIWNIFIDEMCLRSSVKCKNIFVMKTEGIKDMGWSKVSNQTEQSWHNLEFISASSGAGLRNPNASFWIHMAMWSQLDRRSLDSSNLHGIPCKCEKYHANRPWLQKPRKRFTKKSCKFLDIDGDVVLVAQMFTMQMKWAVDMYLTSKT